MAETSRSQYYRELKEKERGLRLEESIHSQEKTNRQLQSELYPSRITRAGRVAGGVANVLFTGAAHSTVHGEPRARAKKKKKSRSYSAGPAPRMREFSIFD